MTEVQKVNNLAENITRILDERKEDDSIAMAALTFLLVSTAQDTGLALPDLIKGISCTWGLCKTADLGPTSEDKLN